MKSLVQYIKEELDDNLWWLLDKWFDRHENQYSEFIEIVIRCKERGRKVNIEFLKEVIQGTFLQHQLRQFVNFIDNEVTPSSNKDYLYVLKMIIEQCMGNDMYDKK